MKFALESMKAQLDESHPDLVDLLRDFEVWSLGQKIPEPFVVEVWRTVRQQGETYAKIWRGQAGDVLAMKAPPHVAKLRARAIMDMTDAELRRLGEKRFTWHMVRCAADIRTRHYTEAQLAQVVKWFKERCQVPAWELVTEKHGTGVHIHAGRRDKIWRDKFTPKEALNV